jgi:hypothetical protein
MFLEAEGAVDFFGDASLVGDDDELFDFGSGKGLANHGVEEGGANALTAVRFCGADVLETGDFSRGIKKEAHVADEFVSVKSAPPVAMSFFLIEAAVGHLIGFEDTIVRFTDTFATFGDLELDGSEPFPIMGEFSDFKPGVGANLIGGTGEGEDDAFV